MSYYLRPVTRYELVRKHDSKLRPDQVVAEYKVQQEAYDALHMMQDNRASSAVRDVVYDAYWKATTPAEERKAFAAIQEHISSHHTNDGLAVHEIALGSAYGFKDWAKR